MQNPDPTRRTALKALALLGVATTGSVGVAAADEHHDDEHHDKDHEDNDCDDGRPDASDLFVASLEPQEGVETDARGMAVVQERQDGLKFVVEVENLENTVMGHIHEDEVLGPIAVWLYDFETQAERLEDGQFTGLLDVGTITDEVIEAGRAPEAESETVEGLLEKIDAGEAYVNIHTEEHPSGEIAGRLEPFDPSTVGPPTDTDEDSDPAVEEEPADDLDESDDLEDDPDDSEEDPNDSEEDPDSDY